MNKRKIIIIISGIAIIAFAYFSMMFLGSMAPTPPKAPHTEVIRYVNAQPVKYNNLTTAITETGRVKSASEIVISAEASGEVLQGDIPFKKGQVFKNGDLLVKIYDTDAKLLLKARKSSFLNLVASVLPDFKITYTESYNTWLNFFENVDIEKDLPDLPKINSTQEKVLLASRNVLDEYYSIKSQEIVIKKYSIYAPFDGAITSVTSEVGTKVNKGGRLGEIINTKNMELEVPVEVRDAKWIKVGDKVEVADKVKSANWVGKVIRKAQNVDDATQSISVFVALTSSAKNPLYKGEYLSATFKGIKLFNVMEIPRSAVFNRDNVFVVNDSLLAKKQINIVKVNQTTLFFNGLEIGENLVVEPLINATENTKVKILENEN